MHVTGAEPNAASARPTAQSREMHMSSVHVSSPARALPFTGFAALPFFIIGGAITIVGAAMALFRPRRPASQRSR